MRKGSKQCQVCRHPERARIELLRAGGAAIDALAEKFGVHHDAIWRHWTHHVTADAKATFLAGPGSLEELAERAAKEGDSVLDYFRLCRTVLTAQLTAMSEAGDGRGAALVAGQLTKTCESIARVTGELSQLARSTTYITNNLVLAESPAWLRVQSAILNALLPYPEARAAVVAALEGLDEGESRTSSGRLAAIPEVISNDE